jgi:hypothetical protein
MLTFIAILPTRNWPASASHRWSLRACRVRDYSIVPIRVAVE